MSVILTIITSVYILKLITLEDLSKEETKEENLAEEQKLRIKRSVNILGILALVINTIAAIFGCLFGFTANQISSTIFLIVFIALFIFSIFLLKMRKFSVIVLILNILFVVSAILLIADDYRANFVYYIIIAVIIASILTLILNIVTVVLIKKEKKQRSKNLTDNSNV